MSNDTKLPNFNEFTRWLAAQNPAPAANEARYATLVTAARGARDEFIEARRGNTVATPARGHLAVLQLLAAADKSDTAQPPEVTTARGFRVTLAFDEGSGGAAGSIGVLVRCPPELIDAVQGETAYLWNGAQRFEIGEFDAEGKAIGMLPAGIEISVTDFAKGNVKLEEPPPPPEE